jgi:hypothetical protein
MKNVATTFRRLALVFQKKVRMPAPRDPLGKADHTCIYLYSPHDRFPQRWLVPDISEPNDKDQPFLRGPTEYKGLNIPFTRRRNQSSFFRSQPPKRPGPVIRANFI